MKTYYNSCYLCGSFDSEKLCSAFFKTTKFPLESIVICKTCGLVYKHPVIPEYEITHYMEKNHWDKKYFSEKLTKTANYVNEKIGKLSKGSLIIDIGAAAGDLLNSLHKYYPNSRLVGIEPSVHACNNAVSANKNLVMLPCTLDECTIADGSVDLITVIGVDYLFLDHNESLRKIHRMLNKEGKVYIERNVFLQSKAYVGRAIKRRRDLFGTNSMMKNWFTITQMEAQLQKYFKIEDHNEVLCNVVDGNKNISHGWLCTKRAKINSSIKIKNEYKENIQYITSMPF